jgi:hypothetical protein
MRDMVMHMTGSNGLLSVPTEHEPGLVALILLGPAIWLALVAVHSLAVRDVSWAERVDVRLRSLGFAARVALVATLVGAVVHAVIVPTHWADARVSAILFVVDTIAFTVAWGWTYLRRAQWRTASVLVLGGTASAYVLYIIKGWETMDLVGLVTTTIEAAAALILLLPAVASVPARQFGLGFAAIAVSVASLLGANVLAGATASSSAAPASAPANAGSGSHASTSGSAMPGMTSGSTSSTTALSLPTTSPAGNISWPDDMSAMGAGMEMTEPNCTAQPTAAQQQAAIAFVNQTVAAARKYANLNAAKAAGYVPVTPTGARIVHYINPSVYRSLRTSGTVLDPERHSGSGLREHGSRRRAVGGHVSGAPWPDAAAAGRLSHAVAHPHRPVFRRRQGRRDGQLRLVREWERQPGDTADDARLDDAGGRRPAGTGPTCIVRGPGGLADAGDQPSQPDRLNSGVTSIGTYGGMNRPHPGCTVRVVRGNWRENGWGTA